MAYGLTDPAPPQFVPPISVEYPQRSWSAFLGRFWRYDSSNNGEIWLKLAMLTLTITIWWSITHWGWVNIPTPLEVCQSMLSLWQQSSLSQKVALSFLRVSIGFTLAALISLPLGLILGLTPHLQIWFSPITAIFRYLLTLTLIFLFFLYFEGNELTKIALIFLAISGYNLVRITEVVRAVPRSAIELCYTLGGNLRQVVFEVILPYTWPHLIEVFRLNVAMSWSLVIVTELLAPKLGSEYDLMLLYPSEFWAYFLILGGLGLAIDSFFRWVLWATCEWSLD